MPEAIEITGGDYDTPFDWPEFAPGRHSLCGRTVHDVFFRMLTERLLRSLRVFAVELSDAQGPRSPTFTLFRFFPIAPSVIRPWSVRKDGPSARAGPIFAESGSEFLIFSMTAAVWTRGVSPISTACDGRLALGGGGKQRFATLPGVTLEVVDDDLGRCSSKAGSTRCLTRTDSEQPESARRADVPQPDCRCAGRGRASYASSAFLRSTTSWSSAAMPCSTCPDRVARCLKPIEQAKARACARQLGTTLCHGAHGVGKTFDQFAAIRCPRVDDINRKIVRHLRGFLPAELIERHRTGFPVHRDASRLRRTCRADPAVLLDGTSSTRGTAAEGHRPLGICRLAVTRSIPAESSDHRCAFSLWPAAQAAEVVVVDLVITAATCLCPTDPRRLLARTRFRLRIARRQPRSPFPRRRAFLSSLRAASASRCPCLAGWQSHSGRAPATRSPWMSPVASLEMICLVSTDSTYAADQLPDEEGRDFTAHRRGRRNLRVKVLVTVTVFGSTLFLVRFPKWTTNQSSRRALPLFAREVLGRLDVFAGCDNNVAFASRSMTAMRAVSPLWHGEILHAWQVTGHDDRRPDRSRCLEAMVADGKRR